MSNPGQRTRLVDTGRKIKRPEDDLPCQIHSVPKIFVVAAERDRVSPESGDVLRIAHQGLRWVPLLRMRHTVRGELVKFGPRGESGVDCG